MLPPVQNPPPTILISTLSVEARDVQPYPVWLAHHQVTVEKGVGVLSKRLDHWCTKSQIGHKMTDEEDYSVDSSADYPSMTSTWSQSAPYSTMRSHSFPSCAKLPESRDGAMIVFRTIPPRHKNLTGRQLILFFDERTGHDPRRIHPLQKLTCPGALDPRCKDTSHADFCIVGETHLWGQSPLDP